MYWGIGDDSTAFDSLGKDVESGREMSNEVEIGHFLGTEKVVPFVARLSRHPVREDGQHS